MPAKGFSPHKLVLYSVLILLLLVPLTVNGQMIRPSGPWLHISVLTAAAAVLVFGIWLVIDFIRIIPDSNAAFRRIAAGSFLLICLVILAYANIYSQLYNLYRSKAFEGETLTAGDFVYYSITTFTTTGYGDITPVHPYANAASASEMLVGFLSSTLLMTIFAAKLFQRKQQA